MVTQAEGATKRAIPVVVLRPEAATSETVPGKQDEAAGVAVAVAAERAPIETDEHVVGAGVTLFSGHSRRGSQLTDDRALVGRTPTP
jgi:hypothetical protein